MNNLERDETTGLWKWPVLSNDDWSRWTEKPCAVLFGRSQQRDWSLKHVSAFDLPSRWPQLQQFRIGYDGYLVLAQGYSQEQALLFAEDVNRQLRKEKLPLKSYEPPGERGMTWGISVPENGSWNLPDALAEAFAKMQLAGEDGRWSSINIADEDWQHNPHDESVVCSWRDGLTGLWSWKSVAALCFESDDEPITLLMADIDDFKRLNDCLGHGAADVPLRGIGDILRSVESVDVAAFRLGGDEFMLLARGFSLERAREMAEEVNCQLREMEFSVDYLEKPFGGLSLTWGIVSSTKVQLEAMLRHADDLIGMAKSENRRGSVNS